jgi:hypothetical protein
VSSCASCTDRASVQKIKSFKWLATDDSCHRG